LHPVDRKDAMGQHHGRRTEHREPGDGLHLASGLDDIRSGGHPEDRRVVAQGAEEEQRGLEHQSGDVDPRRETPSGGAPQTPRREGKEGMHHEGDRDGLCDEAESVEHGVAGVDRSGCEPQQPTRAEQRPHAVMRPPRPREEAGRHVDQPTQREEGRRPAPRPGIGRQPQSCLTQREEQGRHGEERQAGRPGASSGPRALHPACHGLRLAELSAGARDLGLFGEKRRRSMDRGVVGRRLDRVAQRRSQGARCRHQGLDRDVTGRPSSARTRTGSIAARRKASASAAMTAAGPSASAACC